MAEGFQLDLHHRHAIDKQDHVVAMMAVVGVDAQLVDHLEGVLAPVLDVDQGVKQRRAVVPLETVPFAQGAGRHEYVRRNDLLHQPGEFVVREMNPVECLEFLAEVLFQCGAVADIGAIDIFEIVQLCNQILFDLLFYHWQCSVNVERWSYNGRPLTKSL